MLGTGTGSLVWQARRKPMRWEEHERPAENGWASQLIKRREVMSESLEIVYSKIETKRMKKSEVVDAELERLYKKHGVITVDGLLEESKKPKAAMHDFFDWDNEVAGPKWRRAQAYAYIMSSKFVVQLIQDGKAQP